MKYISEKTIPRKTSRDGLPIAGVSGLVYPDESARHGYQIYLSSEADHINVGDMIRVGTAHEVVGNDDPRPSCAAGNYGTGKKLVGHYRRVTRIGREYSMFEDIVVDDESHSYSGERIVGHKVIAVRRVYFEGNT